MTVQIGDGARLAAATGIDVVYDLRANDCSHGGQGAPLAPAYHRALAIGLRRLPIVFVNIGGVANVTWVGGDGRLIAFDTGPGNALIDDWMLRRTGVPRDADGATAARGMVHNGYVAAYLKHSHFALPPPKSLDRNAFLLELIDELSIEDGAATLTAFTAASIAKAREHLPEEPSLWVICGGGRRNRTLMSMLAGHVQNAVAPAEAVGLDGDGLEAEAWAYLAVRSLRSLPITFPGTTGVSRPLTGGRLARVRR
jgi:anhydro-N-acetylmuramic acid kinase